MKKKIVSLMCCLAAIGMFSAGILPVQAAACAHVYHFVCPDSVYDSYVNENGHYKIYGTLFVCASCGEDKYWQDLTTVKTGDHEYSETAINPNKCTICEYVR